MDVNYTSATKWSFSNEQMEINEVAHCQYKKMNLCDFDYILLMPKDIFQIKCKFNKKLANRKGLVIEGKQAQQLITLYSLYEFSDKIIIGSFEEPYGRKLQNLIDCKIATEDELINDVILGAM